MIPGWLRQGEEAVPLPAAGGRGQAFLDKTIRDAAAFAEAVFSSDSIARRGGVLQGIDPRFKLVGFLALIVAVSLLRSPLVVWGVYFATLAVAALSRINPLFFIKRVWLFIPLFAAAIAVPALFSPLTPGEPLFVLAHLGQSRQLGPYRIPAEIAITRQGVELFALFIGRVAASVSLAVLLTLTTRWDRLLASLRVLRVPQPFIMILAMTWRYIQLLVRTVAEMHVARASRTVRCRAVGTEQRWVASRIGQLFRKSYGLSLEVHDAMLSRGFAGEVRLLSPFRATGGDFAWLFLALLLCAAAVMLDRLIS